MNFTKQKTGAALLGLALLVLSHCAALSSVARAQSATAAIRVERVAVPVGSRGHFVQLAFVKNKQAQVTINGGASATVNGVTISSLAVNEAGAVRALIATDCEAGDANFTLRVSEGRSRSAQATLRVFVTNNPPPTLSYAEAQIVAPGGSTTIKPTNGPSDQGRVTAVVVQRVTPRFKGRISVDAQGVVSISKAPTRGSFQVTIRATDNCRAFTDASFTLQVGVTMASPLAKTEPATDATGESKQEQAQPRAPANDAATTEEGKTTKANKGKAATEEAANGAAAEQKVKKGKAKKDKASTEEATAATAEQDVKQSKTKKGKAAKEEAANGEVAEPEVKKAKAKKAEAKKAEAKNDDAKPEKVKKGYARNGEAK